MPTKRLQEFMDLKHGNDKKASKPLMEKRRRARINHSLAQLKSLVIDPNATERSRQAKLEKADILELTVRHLHDIKRRQRTVSLLDTGHPKKKFEMGYSECAREVELFLTNLMDPQLVGTEPELQRRLKDHLSRRLHDLNNIEPLPENSTTQEMLDQSPSEELVSSSVPSPTVVIRSNPSPFAGSLENYPLKETAVNTYSENTRKHKNAHDNTITNVAFSVPMDDFPGSSNSNFSLPSVQHSTIPRDLSASSESSETDGYQYNPAFEQYEKVPSTSSSFECSQPRDLSCSRSKISNESFKQQTGHSFVTNESSNIQENVFNGTSENTRLAYNSERLEDSYRQIHLVPRRLPNGEWALVLPGNLSLSEVGQSPLSAFRLVCPESDHDPHKMRQQYVVSPLSSSVSDMSCEDYCLVTDGDVSVKMEHDGVNEGIHFVWRPW